jgi:hypothetical protein
MQKATDLEERDRIRAFKSPVTGEEIMQAFQLMPGPVIGKIKKYIEEAILDGKIPNEHDAAYEFLLSNKDIHSIANNT